MSLLRIAHLSDPHFGTVLPGVGEGLLATLQTLRPDLVILSGDITQRARAGQFQQAKDFIDKLSAPSVIAVPGNHDIPLFNIFSRFFNPYGGFKNTFKHKLEKDCVHGDVLVTGLNSTSQWRHIQGNFDISRLHKRLKDQKVKAKVHIAVFHHPMDCKKSSDENNLLIGREATIQVLDQAGVDLVLSGHIHDPFVTLSRVRYPRTQRTMILTVAGTCTSCRTRPGAPNSFNFIEVNTFKTPRLTITRYDQRTDLRFTAEQSHHFSRHDELGWNQSVEESI